MQLIDIFKTELENVRENLAAARLGDRPHRELVGSRVDMIDFDAGKTLFEHRINLFGVDLRQRAIAIKRAAFLKSFLINLIE